MNTPGPFAHPAHNESDQLMQHHVRPEDLYSPLTQPIDITAYVAAEAERESADHRTQPELNSEPPC